MMHELFLEGGSSISTLTTSLTNGLSIIATDMLTALGAVLPVVLPVAGGIAVVMIGFKFFKKIAK